MGGQGFCASGPGPTWVGWEDRTGYRDGLSGVKVRAKGQCGEGSKDQASPQGSPVLELPLAFTCSQWTPLCKEWRPESQMDRMPCHQLEWSPGRKLQKVFYPIPALWPCFLCLVPISAVVWGGPSYPVLGRELQFWNVRRLILCSMKVLGAVLMSETLGCLGNRDVLPVTIKRDTVAAVVRQPTFYWFFMVKKCPKWNAVFLK